MAEAVRQQLWASSILPQDVMAGELWLEGSWCPDCSCGSVGAPSPGGCLLEKLCQGRSPPVDS